jgi:hypothetical protein
LPVGLLGESEFDNPIRRRGLSDRGFLPVDLSVFIAFRLDFQSYDACPRICLGFVHPVEPGPLPDLLVLPPVPVEPVVVGPDAGSLLAIADASTMPRIGGLTTEPTKPSLLASASETPRFCAIVRLSRNVIGLMIAMLCSLSIGASY